VQQKASVTCRKFVAGAKVQCACIVGGHGVEGGKNIARGAVPGRIEIWMGTSNKRLGLVG